MAFLPRSPRKLPDAVAHNPAEEVSPDFGSVTQMAPPMAPLVIVTDGPGATKKKRVVKQGMFDSLLFRAEAKSMRRDPPLPCGPKQRRDEIRAKALRTFELAVVTGGMKVRLNFDVPIQRPEATAQKKRKKAELEEVEDEGSTLSDGLREADRRLMFDSTKGYRNRAAYELANIRAGCEGGQVANGVKRKKRNSAPEKKEEEVVVEVMSTPPRRVLRSDSHRKSNEKVDLDNQLDRTLTRPRVLRSNSKSEHIMVGRYPNW